MGYLDFDIEIGVGNGREYPVAVLRSAAGEAREIMYFPFDTLALENQLLTLQNVLLRSGSNMRLIHSKEEQFVQNFGSALFNALFTGEVRSRYVVSQHEALFQDKGLRVRLRIHTPKLAVLPWEFMYDPNQAEHLCLSSNTPVVRYLELPQPLQPLIVTLPLSILGMTASPKSLPLLDIEREKLRVEKALERLRAKGMVKLNWLTGQTWQDLQRTMRHGPWHIFHFIGHGGFNSRTDEGLIALEDDDGQEYHMSATSLGRMLVDHRSLRLVVLNSCEGARGSEQDIFSSTASILVRRGIPAVLAMQYEITDKAAIELSRAFYEAIAEGTSVDMAVSEARKAISFAAPNTVEWGTPVLYTRSSDGLLFDLKQVTAMQEKSDTIVEPPLSSSLTISERHRTTTTSNDENLQSLAKEEEYGKQIDHSTTPLVAHSEPLLPFISPSNTLNVTNSNEIFCCYAHKDEQLLHQLKAHLKPLQRQGFFSVWSDREVTVSTDWEPEIDKRLNTAQIILLLVSADFMSSDYVYGIEMKQAIERHERGEARVVPIILRPVRWEGAFGKLQALPTDAKPIVSSSWNSIDEAFLDVTKGISHVLHQTSFITPLEMISPNINTTEPIHIARTASNIKVFMCYAHEDEMLRRELETFFMPLRRTGLIDLWYDRDISVGTEWEREIDNQMNAAQVILLLVSPDFMNSDYCYGIEMKRAIERHEQGEAYVIPIILRPVYWQIEPLSSLQALPTDGTPVISSKWYNRDEAFFNIVEHIKKIIDQIISD